MLTGSGLDNAPVDEANHLLVLPGMFPRYPGDIYGIFVYDYLESVKPYYEISVVAGQVVGDKKRVHVEHAEIGTIYRFGLVQRSVDAMLKMALIPVWFIKSWSILSKMKRVGVIHTHRVLFEGLLAACYSKWKKTPSVITVHTGPFQKLLKTKLMGAITRWVLENVNAVLVVSEDLKQQVLDAGITPSCLEVTYNPVDTDLFKLAESSPTNAMILFAGRLESYKGGLRTVKAFQAVCDDYPCWSLILIGDGPEKNEIEALLQSDERLRGRVKMTGMLSKAEIAEYMQAASFFVYPSVHETFGLVIAEAMSSGLPVIVGNETAPKEYVDSECGLLVPPEDVKSISDAMRVMIEHRARYDARAIRQKVVERFGFEAFGRQLSGIYKNLKNQCVELVES